MSSPYNSDGEETVEQASGESKKKTELKLETELKSLQVCETTQEAQSSPTDKVGNKSSTTCYNEINPNIRDHFQPAFPRIRGSGTSPAETTKWRQKKENTSVSQSSGWRDRNYKYVRESSTNKRIYRNPTLNEDSNRNRVNYYKDERNWRRGNRSSSFEDTSVNQSHFDKNRQRSKMGNWSLVCASDILLDNGLTELEHVRNCVAELHKQNGNLFAARPSEYETPEGGTKINCYTSDYENKAQIVKVADALIEKIGTYPYCFYYFHDNKIIYMRTQERELYELTGSNYKLIEFEE